MKSKYRLHMLSFEDTDRGGFNVAFGNGANLQPWHLDIVEAWLKAMREKESEARALWDSQKDYFNGDDLV